MISVTNANLNLLSTEDKELALLRYEMIAIKKWLSDNDYIVNKFLLGEYEATNPKWIEYSNERKKKLTRYNNIEKAVLKALKEKEDNYIPQE